MFDVIVVGSGGGAQLSAVRAHDLGLNVLVIEKSELYGGTSATSGGALWIPLNGQAKDDYASAYTYLKAAAGDTATDSKLRAYLESGAELIRFINEKTALRYKVSEGYADYYPEMPGAVESGRAMEPLPFDGSLLGEEFFRLRPSHPGSLLMGMSMTIPESNAMATKAPGWIGVALKILARYWLDLPWRFKTRRDRRLCLGNALIGGLRQAMLARDIPLWLECPMQSLIVENGRVQGVMAHRGGHTVMLRARRGVILAAGGFERNQQMREQYLPQPTRQEWSVTPANINTGDAIRAAQAIGAKLENMTLAWGVPSVRHPDISQGTQAIFAERGFGGLIAVNQQGRRFVNESISYDRFYEALYRDHAKTGGSIPAWLIFDAQHRKDCPLGPLLPAAVMPDSKVPKAWWGDFVFKDASLEGLARRIGVDPTGLADSVRRNNEYARTGVDQDFHRGESAFDRYWALRNAKPNPCLVKIEKPPFYAVKIQPGDTGTKGGPAITDDGQVIAETGEPIPGLYCIGNNAAAPLGRAYGGAGGTLGPSLVFGFRAVNHLARTTTP
ncbi:3-ketosteroid-delta1-dehydrogenase [Steroidobacter denitrificans]|uniref:3-ketosteroid-delta1-dehydrogenase n=1 Tax=Steroidobacter denitrificans TaxID=465721 RepID=A0A127F7I1_STEDE|nr:3-ketosteroid-delta1-dehydrogenase [Steroidobacter denitrificans]